MLTKICNTCKVEKSLAKFNNNKNAKDGKDVICKECRRQYYQSNKKTILAQKKKYYQANKETILMQNKKWIQNNPNKMREYDYKHQSKRKGWQMPKPLNEYFEGSQLHHLHSGTDHQICIYIPIDLHKSVWHAHNKLDTMIDINLKVLQWYYGLTIKW